MSLIIVLSTFPDKKSAESVAEQSIQKDLAACTNIVRIENSIYRWKGNIQNHPEFLVLFKTTQKAYLQLEFFIKQNHPNEIPEILYLEVKGGQKDYAAWVEASVLSKLLSVPLDFKATRRVGTPPTVDTSARKPRTLSI